MPNRPALPPSEGGAVCPGASRSQKADPFTAPPLDALCTQAGALHQQTQQQVDPVPNCAPRPVSNPRRPCAKCQLLQIIRWLPGG